MVVIKTAKTEIASRNVYSTLATDFYKVLSVSRSASAADIKAAYHRALLRNHPDKNTETSAVDIASIQEAHRVLSSPDLRAQYDAKQDQRHETGPRPAHLLSLDEFRLQDHRYIHRCRCGGIYEITEMDLDEGLHLVGCNSCSEVVWVGYELAQDE
ncbi:DnaJ domain-containing protein [Mycena floridula]|nr:DnaJ domain-containing protein [Mycena floridula]